MEIDRRRYDAHDPVSKGTPQISEDDSDEGPLHAIIREETERQSARESEAPRPAGTGEESRDGQEG
jgi:hypothetical protein